MWFGAGLLLGGLSPGRTRRRRRGKTKPAPEKSRPGRDQVPASGPYALPPRAQWAGRLLREPVLGPQLSLLAILIATQARRPKHDRCQHLASSEATRRAGGRSAGALVVAAASARWLGTMQGSSPNCATTYHHGRRGSRRVINGSHDRSPITSSDPLRGPSPGSVGARPPRRPLRARGSCSGPAEAAEPGEIPRRPARQPSRRLDPDVVTPGLIPAHRHAVTDR